jgi:O6-methylguanine-DNA--protein-cysteine methyltransferase
LEIHENYKHLVEETNRREAKFLQSRQEHSAELQQLLAQLSEAESDKTALMQRQIELGFPPPSAFKKVWQVESNPVGTTRKCSLT